MNQLDETLLSRELTRRSLRPQPGDTDSARSGGPAIAIAVVIALALAAGVWFVRHESARVEPAPSHARSSAPSATSPAQPVGSTLTELLPPLEQSDALVRNLATPLTASPEFARWLGVDTLVRRFVASVVNVSEGVSPVSHLRFLLPEGSFRTRTEGTRVFADPASFARYDRAVDAFVSIDTERAAALYRRLHLLFDEAYTEIGNPARTFDATLAAAINDLLSVPVSEDQIELVPKSGNFAYADASLEQRSAAAKQLLRLGSKNARRVQAKLRDLAAALALETR